MFPSKKALPFIKGTKVNNLAEEADEVKIPAIKAKPAYKGGGLLKRFIK